MRVCSSHRCARRETEVQARGASRGPHAGGCRSSTCPPCCFGPSSSRHTAPCGRFLGISRRVSLRRCLPTAATHVREEGPRRESSREVSAPLPEVSKRPHMCTRPHACAHTHSRTRMHARGFCMHRAAPQTLEMQSPEELHSSFPLWNKTHFNFFIKKIMHVIQSPSE